MHYFFTGWSCTEGFQDVSSTSNPCTSTSSSGCSYQGISSGSPDDGRQLWIFPSMKITCTGMLRGLTVVGDLRDREDPFPMLQIWRATGPTSYAKITDISSLPFPTACYRHSNGVHQCTLASPVTTDDVIGILLPRNHRNHAAFSVSFLPASTQTSYILKRITDGQFSTSSPDEYLMISNDLPVLSLDGTLSTYYIYRS